jgi:hypothetical protein
MQDEDKEKKRKRGPAPVSSDDFSQISVADENVAENHTPPKRVRGRDEYLPEAHNVTTKTLSKSIESLYASILSAQKELEAGRNWRGDAFADM